VRVGWRHDGHSAFSAATRRRDEVRIPTRGFGRLIRIAREELERRRRAIRLARARTFGTGVHSELLFGDPWATVYRVGPNRELLDRPVARTEVRRSGERATVANAKLLRDVARADELLPTRVAGTLGRGRPGKLRDLAVAVNGRIRAVGRSFRLRRRPTEYFSLLVPEDALRPGRNVVELFEVRPRGALVRLARVS
ncbi:MAG: hypothetical protein ICV69_15715, partial [Thermoleophilaceae bacterium]|nr:hypothetical protein [Thermoleophilaceae bacterium]